MTLSPDWSLAFWNSVFKKTKANAVQHRSLAGGYFYLPSVGCPTIPDVFTCQVSHANTGLGARGLQSCELGSFLIGNDFGTVSDIEVVAHGNRLSVRNRYQFRTNCTPLSPLLHGLPGR
jgi:hypothetical protein